MILSLMLTPSVMVVNTNDLTEEDLINRNGKIIVEQIQGVCLDAAGNGQIFTDSEYDYINYEGLDVKPGDVVTTYCIYNPRTNYTDDIIKRIDVVNPGN